MPSVLKVNEIQSDTSLPLVFNVGNAERGRIDTSGNMGIGTSSPRSLLNPRGSGSIGAVLTLENSSTAVGSGEALGSIEFYSNDASTGGTGIKGKIASVDDTGFGQNYALTFSTGYVTGGATALTERARFNSSGAFVFAGGTTTADGIGITFPATQSASTNANTLDDYEEGTWTPTITAASGTYTTVTASGSYIKIGKAVTVRIRVDIGNNGTAATRMNIANFPFAAENTQSMSGATREDQNTGNGFVASPIGTNSITVNRYDATYGLATGAGFTLCITYITS